MFAVPGIVSMTLRDLRQSSAFRLALVYSALFALSVASALFVLYATISHNLAERQKARVEELRNALVDVAKNETPEGVKRIVEGYASDVEPDDNVFLLTNAAGDYIAGNIKSLPYFPGWRSIPRQDLQLLMPWSTTSPSTAVEGRWTEVNGGRLFIAESNGDRNEVERIVVKTLFLAALLASGLVLAGGIVIGRRTHRRLASIETALDSVASGNLAARLPRHASKDDLDHISELTNTALARLQTAVRSLKQVTSNVAHDLKAPIGRAIQKLEAIEDTGESTVNVAEIGDVRSGLKLAIQTFEALLRIAEIESGARKARFKPVNFNVLIENVVDILEPIATESGHRLTGKTAAAAATADGDQELLTQACINLVENAIRHCSKSASIQVKSEVSNGVVSIVVSDDGPGIPEIERDKVLERLYRLEKSRTTPGSGLGLSLVAAIADLHGAQLTLSDNHPGLVVTMLFPKLQSF